MKRKAIEDLIKWKETNNRKPILLTGAKGVGKTYLAYDFAKAFFERIFYVNFQRDPLLKKLFNADDNITIDLLIQHFDMNKEEQKDTQLLILDEISYCDAVIKLVKLPQFLEQFPYIICISSSPISSVNNDDYNFLPVYPLEFDEFLRAAGYEWYIDLICTHYNCNTKLPDIVHKELLDLFHLYLEIGGMPGSINEYLNLNSVVNVSEQHSFLKGAFRDCLISEYAESDSFKMIQVLDSITHQLMKENKKFQYKLIRKGTTNSMYREAIQKLTEINYIIKCSRMNNEQLISPGESRNPEDFVNDDSNTAFKLYLLDTGLLNSKIAEEYDTSLNHHYLRALLENYMAQSLQSKHYPFSFWESDSMAKIDFIIWKEDSLIPIELHTDINTRSKSLSIFKQKYEYPYAIKVSAKNFEIANNIKYVPFYAVFCI